MSEMYNPKYKTKQVYDLDINVTGSPKSNQVYYWLSQQGGQLYENYRLFTSSGYTDKSVPVITSDVGSSVVYNFDNTSSIDFNVNQSNISAQVKISNLQDNVLQIQSDGLYVAPASNVDITSAYITSGYLSSNAIILEYNDSSKNVNIDLSDIEAGNAYITSANLSSSTLTLQYEDATKNISVDLSGIETEPTYITSGHFSSNTLTLQYEDATKNVSVDLSDIKVNPLNYLLFRIPEITEFDEFYHLYVEFSETDDFSTVITYNTRQNASLFRVFTGNGVSNLPFDASSSSSEISAGLNYLFSDEQLQLDISSINENYKYFRFHWTNDEGQTFGRYGYGNRQAAIQIFDASSQSSSVPNNMVIQFTSSDGTGVSWSGNVATFIHTMNCIPVVTMYNSSNIQIMCEINVISANSFSIDFQDKSIVTGTWKLILGYGMPYQS